MAAVPKIFELLLERRCSICQENFILNKFPEVDVDNAILFFKKCYLHPCHANCSMNYYESIDPEKSKLCVECRAELGNLDGVIMTPMYPPLLQEAPSEPNVEMLPPESLLADATLKPSLQVNQETPTKTSLEMLPPKTLLADATLKPSENHQETPTETFLEMLPACVMNCGGSSMLDEPRTTSLFSFVDKL